MDFLGDIVEEFTPSEQERRELKRVIERVTAAIRGELKKQRIDAEVMLGGSAAKGTFLRHDFDCDCFVRFARSYAKKRKSISDITEKVLKEIFGDVERVPGSRDYFQFEHEGVEFEVVPVVKVRDHREVQNVTDASPLHVAWITDKLEKRPQLRREILLTKLFLKANDLYGAESYIRGFSGHVVDLLVIHYGGFLELLRGAAGWEVPEIIDVHGHHKDALKAIDRSKHGALILVDPVQPKRNAAAALSKKNFLRMRELAREFLENPTKKMFRRKEVTQSQLEREAAGRRLLLLRAEPEEGKHDVMGSKMMKLFQFLRNQLEGHGFGILDSGWRFTPKRGGKPEAMFWFILPRERLPEYYEHMGPPVDEGRHVERFRKSHRRTFVRGTRIYARVRREYRLPQNLIRDLIREKHPYIASRAKRLTLIVRTPG